MFNHRDMRMTFVICLQAVGKFPNAVLGLIHWALHIVELCCGEIGLSFPIKRLVAFTRKRKLPVFVESRIFGNTA